ncbi:MAG: hypothetical protein AAF664_16425, partial [Planctomycetota bacterium]
MPRFHLVTSGDKLLLENLPSPDVMVHPNGVLTQMSTDTATPQSKNEKDSNERSGKDGQVAHRLPAREQVPAEDCWDLSSLYRDTDAWEADFARLEEKIPTYESFKGHLGESAAKLGEALDFD